MAYSEAQKRATAKHVKKTLDDIKTRVPKGQKQIYHTAAEELGYTRANNSSFNKFVIQAIEEKIARESTNKNKNQV